MAADLVFLPFYADTLQTVIHRAAGRGGVDVTVRPDIDPAAVSRQVQLYARRLGVQVRCRTEGDRVRVRQLPTEPPHIERAG